MLDASRVVSSEPETDDFKKWVEAGRESFWQTPQTGQGAQVDIKKPQNGTESPLIRHRRISRRQKYMLESMKGKQREMARRPTDVNFTGVRKNNALSVVSSTS
jgi:hypothetical protein